MILPVAVIFGQTTGKIPGTVVDADTGEPLPGVNVALEGIQQCATADEEGYIAILNVDPGTYSLTTAMIDYLDQRL